MTSRSSPSQVGTSQVWAKLNASNSSCFLIAQTGALWVVGDNYGYGMLGQGEDSGVQSSLSQVGALTDWSTVNVGFGHALAVKTNGTLWSWGRNASGQMGSGDRVSRSSPVQIGSLATWAKVSSGNGTSLAVTSGRTLWGWGDNAYGQLGLGDLSDRSSPVQIGSLAAWSMVAAGQLGSAGAIKTDGTLWVWGNNVSGQLALGNTTSRSSPVQLGSLNSWAFLAMADDFSAFIKTDGTLWMAGTNSTGHLGLEDTAARSSPVQVGSLSDWARVSVGNDTSMAIKTDGTLWGWGTGTGGALGIVPVSSYSSPVQVGSLNTWTDVSCGINYKFGIALKNDGSVWGFGQCTEGEYGLTLGPATALSSPIQIGSLTGWAIVDGGGTFAAAIRS